MRKKFLSGKRVLALALAFSMVVSEAAFATPADVTEPEAVEQVVETEIVSANEAQEVVTVAPSEETESPEEETEAVETTENEDAEQEAEEEPEAEQAPDGTLSQVIGVKGQPNNNYLTDGKGNVVGQYAYAHSMVSTLYVKGELKEDPVLGCLSYGGKLYTSFSYSKYEDVTSITTTSEVVAIPGTSAREYYDAATGFYKVNNTYYYNLREINNKPYVNPRDEVQLIGIYDNSDRAAVNKQYGRYVRSHDVTDPEDLYYYTPDYYEVNGRVYTSSGISWKSRYDSVNRRYQYVCYAAYTSEIILGSLAPVISWYPLTNPNINKDKYEKNSMIRYEVLVNGASYGYDSSEYVFDAAGQVHYLTSGNSKVLGDMPLANGQSVKVQVRGVLCHWENKQVANEDGEVYGKDVLVLDSFGEWSDELTYTMKFETAVPKVTTISAAKVPGYGQDIVVKWNAVPQCNSYNLYYIRSKKPLAVTAESFTKYYYKDNDTLTAAGIQYDDFWTSSETSLLEPETKLYYTASDIGEYCYFYFAVGIAGVADGSKYVEAYGYDPMKTIAAVASYQTSVTVAKTPALTGVKLEKQANGTFDLVWNKVDADIVLYVYDSKTFPNLYQYAAFSSSVQRKETDANGNEEWYSLYEDLHNRYYSYASDLTLENISKDKLNYDKVGYRTFDGNDGRYEDVIGSMDLAAGKTYYFVAYTYDRSDLNTDKAPITYTYAARYYKNNTPQTMTVNASYTRYPALGAPTAVLSAKAKLEKPYVTTFSSPKSIKFQMSSPYGSVSTGYEIYRKEGKKYKKVATVASNVYTDEGLKSGVTYNYKVRAYGYRPGSKKAVYSEYTFLTAKTYAAGDLDLHVSKASKNSAKLKWTKVPNATKYEVYRTDEYNADSYTVSKKFSAAGVKTSMAAEGYKLMKTLSGSASSFTDKKLQADQWYGYIVVAYYKQGGSTLVQYEQGSVGMKLTAPVNVKAERKGKKIAVTWDKDKYAAGYEISYYICDKYGYNTTSEPIIKTTKKASYTISGVELGGSVTNINVRAFNKKKEYSEYASTSYRSSYVPLAAVKGITAKTVTNADGKEGVKITWKKVSGAKYYKVYRSTREATYDADEKLYYTVGTTISKDGNDNYETYSPNSQMRNIFNGNLTNNDVNYAEYEGVYGSIVGTSAYDFSGDMAAGVTYYYTVQAFGEVPSGQNDSPIYSVYCSKPAQVVAKTGLDFTATSKKGKVTLTWKAMENGKVTYTIYRATSAKGKYAKIGTSKKPTFTDKKSKKGKTYYYKIQATGTNGLKADVDVTGPAKKVKAK